MTEAYIIKRNKTEIKRPTLYQSLAEAIKQMMKQYQNLIEMRDYYRDESNSSNTDANTRKSIVDGYSEDIREFENHVHIDRIDFAKQTIQTVYTFKGEE